MYICIYIYVYVNIMASSNSYFATQKIPQILVLFTSSANDTYSRKFCKIFVKLFLIF